MGGVLIVGLGGATRVATAVDMIRRTKQTMAIVTLSNVMLAVVADGDGIRGLKAEAVGSSLVYGRMKEGLCCKPL